MKKILLAVIATLLLGTEAETQQPKPCTQLPTVAERRACYEQARRFVEDLNKDMKGKTRETGTVHYSYMASHYNPRNADCLVEYADLADGTTLGTASKTVADAFGGGEVAYFVGEPGKPRVCAVRAESCINEPQFDAMVRKLFEDQQ